MSNLSAVRNFIVAARGCFVDVYNESTESHNIIKVPTFSASLESAESDAIVDTALSPDGAFLAVMTGSSKRLLVYKTSDLEPCQVYSLPRAASRIRFSPESSQILVADKTGDALLFELKNSSSGIKLFGHLSLLLDILMTDDMNYVITSDRDEKIRVSHYPNTYNIKSYCMGHKEFVKHIQLMPHNRKYLLSASGDGTVKIWDYVDGRLCYTIETAENIDNEDILTMFKETMDKEGVEVNTLPVVLLSSMPVDSDTSLIAVSVFNHLKVLIYALTESNHRFQHKLLHALPFKQLPSSLLFHNGKLLVYLDGEESVVQEYQVPEHNNDASLSLIFTHKMFSGHLIRNNSSNDRDLNLLYKRKFDNVQEYQERKRQRLEKYGES